MGSMTEPLDFEFEWAYRGESSEPGHGLRPPWSSASYNPIVVDREATRVSCTPRYV